ncbi:DUF5686 and carboxypeptidase-like regulatory domain-containing protein [Mucilaginibacter sp. dw_454]|uniref:DUF5686 and carboxypeptidase-like regulatory domain-containing protein n=1 Tax=Mucilaginibacter sp. dw_454 TaxID=2720079 RepID=UPI001BD5AB26|nr:DUF5686 and carboxypeptidase-like regulatory domain-containing protein [Mucilaginibacter sp. dw_454]
MSKFCFAQQTTVKGRVSDAATGQPLLKCSVFFLNTHTGTSTDSLGKFTLTGNGTFSKIVISAIGYQSLTRNIVPGTQNKLDLKLGKSTTQLKEVAISARRRYRNKGNPAVELIRQVIAHKDDNRPQSANYVQYDQYERIGLTLFSIPPPLVNNFLFKPYKFMLDTAADGKLSAEVYLAEKKYKQYSRRDPEKSISVLQAQKESNIIKFVDTAGVNIYVNRIYGDKIDIYENNIFIIRNQLLSPIADHAPDFYKFFIKDTIRTAKDTMVELSFTPRNKTDLLFEGHLMVSLNGSYAVTACELNVNNQININFLRNLNVNLDFQKQANGRYFLVKSDAKADFGILKNKGFGVKGERTIYYSNYLVDKPLAPTFYQGKDEQVLPDFNQADSSYWAMGRPDTLSQTDARFYHKVGRLENMKSFKRATWLATTFTGGFADAGAFQFDLGQLAAYSPLEGLRLGLGGRTTPKFNKTIYLEGYVAEGTRDHQFKHQATAYYSFNNTPQYRYPNNYLKLTQKYDIGLPGDDQAGRNFHTPVSSFQTGSSRYYFYTHIVRIDYVKEYDNHFSFDIGFYNRNQSAAGTLKYTLNDLQQTVVNHITSSVLSVSLRYAPHEQIYQNNFGRNTIKYKYPIFTLVYNQGIKDVFNSTNNYSSITASITKRFYLSQLGRMDFTLTSGEILGKVPYPLLNVSAANQSVVYEPDAYNQMHYLEFVNDHYAGLNITQNFNGFFLNKVPLIKYLKWREYLTFKVLYGGLRAENNPALSSNLYNFPAPAASGSGTYALGNTPYTEAGVGIGNIFKVLRIDGIERFTYLDHPGISKYGVKFTVNIDL